jgi:hypothetical protein
LNLLEESGSGVVGSYSLNSNDSGCFYYTTGAYFYCDLWR